MPTLGDLLTDIDDRYRNGYTEAQKVRWMNYVQNQIYPKIKRPPVSTNLTTTVDVDSYALPTGVKPRDIISVTRETELSSGEFQRVEYKELHESSDGDYYTIVDGDLVFSPVPDATGIKIILYYHKYTPTQLSETTKTAIPDLEVSFHELLVLGTLERVAGARKDITMKNNFAIEYESLYLDYLTYGFDSQPDYPAPKDDMIMGGLDNGSTVDSNFE